MENFIVSARKYRPQTFDTVVGQSHITTTLKNALRNNHLAQAFLFCGPRGVGKTTCARILAKTINCLSPTAEWEACGSCDNCVAFQRNGALNVYELDAASNNSVDDIRNLVEQVRFPPQSGRRKVYIIDEVHMLSTSAFNAFLKTLEEPPSYVIFILATTEKHKIIPTILSRCQIFDFRRIEPRDIAQHLEKIAQREHIKAEYDALELIAQKADGGLRDALSLFDMLATFGGEAGINYQNALQNLHILDYDYYFRVTDALRTASIADAYLILDEVLSKGFDGRNFVIGLAKHLRDLLVCRDARTLPLLEVSDKIRARYATQAKACSQSFLLSAMQIAAACEATYKDSKAPRLHVELALAKIAHLPDALRWASHTAQVMAEIEKKKLAEVAYTAPEAAPAQVREAKSETYTSSAALAIPSLAQLHTDRTNTLRGGTGNGSTINPAPTIKKEEAPSESIPLAESNLHAALEFYKKTNLQHDIDRVFRTPPSVRDADTLVFKLTPEQAAIYRGFEADFVDKMQKRYRNAALRVVVEEYEPIVQEKTYTNYQRYEYLLKRYPLIAELQSQLDLEVDH